MDIATDHGRAAGTQFKPVSADAAAVERRSRAIMGMATAFWVTGRVAFVESWDLTKELSQKILVRLARFEFTKRVAAAAQLGVWRRFACVGP